MMQFVFRPFGFQTYRRFIMHHGKKCDLSGSRIGFFEWTYTVSQHPLQLPPIQTVTRASSAWFSSMPMTFAWPGMGSASPIGIQVPLFQVRTGVRCSLRACKAQILRNCGTPAGRNENARKIISFAARSFLICACVINTFLLFFSLITYRIPFLMTKLGVFPLST